MGWCVHLLQILMAASLSYSLLQDEGESCENILDAFHLQNDQLSACKVPKLLAEDSKQYLFSYVTFQHLDTSISKDVLNWYRHCVPFEGIHAVLKARQSYESASTPTHSVDYLFILEMPCEPGNSNTMDALLDSIRALVDLTQDRDVFHNVRTQFGFILYSSFEEKPKYIYAKDFSPDFPSDLRTLLHKSANSVEDCPRSTVAMSYKTVGSALKVIGKSLRLISGENKFHLRLTLANNRSLYMWHRPYSDLHIVSVIDIGGAKYDQGKGDDYKRTKRSTEHVITKLSEKLASASPYPLTLHNFFAPSNVAAKSLLGHPKMAVRYPDCSHFKKAATLQSLIAAETGDTLQAVLLSKGIEYQLHHLQELENTLYLMNISPALSTPLGVRPNFPDLCSVTKDTPSKRKNQYCSSLHGWTEREASAAKSDLFQDKVPLTDQYISDHADIARSVPTSGGHREKTEELSISEMLGGGGAEPVVVGQPRTLQWKREAPFIKDVIAGAEPVTLRGTVVDTWPALQKWNMAYLSHNMDTDILEFVKCTNSFLTFDPDHRAPLKLNISLSYTLANLSTSDFFRCVESNKACFDGYKGHYYFGSVPDSLKKDVSPDNLLYNMDRDRKAAKQFMWISSAGMITHTHFDQDYNIFVQLVGTKRFTLWSAPQHELMYMYPRVHPMWHKSRVNYRDVDVARFPAFTRARAVQVELGVGDVLYVPPYTWHYVETLTPSVSLSTWSHDYELYDHMNTIYKHDHKFDLLQSQKGQMFVLRLYLDMMVHDLFGFNETTQFFARLVHNRFTGLEHLFPPSEDDPEICTSSIPGKIPTCVHVHGYAKLDMNVVGRHFRALQPVARDVLFGDYVEEITAQVVGVKKMLAFFRYCFLGQEYYVTDIEDEEHLLWEHKDSGEE